jgi:hypothetical protein
VRKFAHFEMANGSIAGEDANRCYCTRCQARHVPSSAAPPGTPPNGDPTSFSTRGRSCRQRDRCNVSVRQSEIVPRCCTNVYQAVPMLVEEDHGDRGIGTAQNTIGAAVQT